jgi:hypothetical protein
MAKMYIPNTASEAGSSAWASPPTECNPDQQEGRPAADTGPTPVRRSGVVIPADTTRLYHLTPLVNVQAILRDGIRAGREACVYCFNDLRAAHVVARDQVLARRYAVFEIDLKALDVEVETDVAVWTREPYQRLVRQRMIAPGLLRLVGVFDAGRGPAEHDYSKCDRWGWGRERTKAVLELSDRFAYGEMTTGQFAAELDRLWRREGGGGGNEPAGRARGYEVRDVEPQRPSPTENMPPNPDGAGAKRDNGV